MSTKPKKHKFVFLGDESLRRRVDTLLKRESFRVIANDRSDLLRLALVEYLERHEGSHANSPVSVGRPAKPKTRTPKPYTLGPNAVPA